MHFGADFATDHTHLDEHRDQHRRTLRLVEIRQGAFASRHGQTMPEENIWLRERRRELTSLTAIISSLETAGSSPVHGAGTPSRATEPKATREPTPQHRPPPRVKPWPRPKKKQS